MEELAKYFYSSARLSAGKVVENIQIILRWARYLILLDSHLEEKALLPFLNFVSENRFSKYNATLHLVCSVFGLVNLSGLILSFFLHRLSVLIMSSSVSQLETRKRYLYFDALFNTKNWKMII